jgi:hypothetical protein
MRSRIEDIQYIARLAQLMGNDRTGKASADDSNSFHVVLSSYAVRDVFMFVHAIVSSLFSRPFCGLRSNRKAFHS